MLSITIFFILITLVSTTVNSFWDSSRRTKRLIFFLALASSCGSIYQAYKDNDNYQNLHNLLATMVVSDSSLPSRFEESLEEAAISIAKQKGYETARLLRRNRSDQRSENSDFIISFYYYPTDIDTKSHIKCEEILHRIGLGCGYIHVTKMFLEKLVIEFSKGKNVETILKSEVLWIWDEIDLSDERFLQSINGIGRSAYITAATIVETKYNFQESPEKYQTEIRFDDDKHVVVAVKNGDCEYEFTSTGDGFLDRLVNIDAITRGGIIYAHILNFLIEEFSTDDTPICLGL